VDKQSGCSRGDNLATAIKIGCEKDPVDLDLIGKLCSLLLDHVDGCRECLACGHGSLAIGTLAAIDKLHR
jgi:hypothetical protein